MNKSYFTYEQLKFIQKNNCKKCKYYETSTEYFCNNWKCEKLKKGLKK